jgi:antitoxin (DNA-binding transcriptional repressor) of toxin-antitoxin stability system
MGWQPISLHTPWYSSLSYGSTCIVGMCYTNNTAHEPLETSHALIAGRDASILLATDQGRDNVMSTVTIEEAQVKLPEIIDKLAPGEELIITRNNQPVAKLVGQQRPVRKSRQPGSAKGKLIIHSDDDEHLEDFKDYMP